MNQAVRSALAVMMHTVGLKPARHGDLKGRVDVERATVLVGSANNSGVSYLRAGDPKGIRIILVHGTPGKAEGWSDYLLDPPAGTEVVALDRPGFGHSVPLRAVPQLKLQAAAVAALLPQNGRGAVLVGHSLGGAVVAQVAANWPERVSGLVLLAAALDPSLERLHPLQPLVARWPLVSMLPRSLRHSNQELLSFKGELEGLGPELHRIEAPTWVVHGTQDDLVSFANVAYMQRMLTSVSQLEVQRIEGGDHFLPWNAKAIVRRALVQAAERVVVPA